jgi:hypothetical protein
VRTHFARRMEVGATGKRFISVVQMKAAPAGDGSHRRPFAPRNSEDPR